MNRFCLASLLCLAVAQPTTVAAAPKKADAKKPSAAHRKLVQSLGDKSFRVRRSAKAKLLALGTRARPALTEALATPDLEVRMACHKLLLQIAQQDTEKKLQAFIRGDDQVGKRLPGWTKLKGVIGDDGGARRFYVRMVRAESDLFDAFESNSPLVLSRYSRRLNTMRYSNLYRRNTVSIDSIAAILVVGAMSNVKMNSSQISNLYYLLISHNYKKFLDRGTEAPRLRKVIEYWMVRNSSGFSSYYMLQMSMRLNLKSGGLKIARRALRKRRTSYSYTMMYAALVIGRFGNKKVDVPILEKQLDNKFVCYRSSRATIQVRDVCLAVLVELTKQKHVDYGFKNIRRSTQTLFFYTSIKFATDKDRVAGIKKWRTWSAANLHKKPKAA